MKDKFKMGDLVQLTTEIQRLSTRRRSFTGVVTGYGRLPGSIRVQRDGLKSVELWHETQWEHQAAGPDQVVEKQEQGK